MKLMNPYQLRMTATASELLYQEGRYLDTRDWDAWLQLYTPAAEYWVPAWKSELQPTADPRSETSLIYYAQRSGLEDRVWRVRSGTSPASRLLPRTQHQVSNVSLGPAHASIKFMEIRYNWQVNLFEQKTKKVTVFFGHAEADLILEGEEWRFNRKKILLLNDYIPTKLDFYSV